MDAAVVEQVLDGRVHQLVLVDERHTLELRRSHVRRQVIAATEVGNRHNPAWKRRLKEILHLVLKHHVKNISVALYEHIQTIGVAVELVSSKCYSAFKEGAQ